MITIVSFLLSLALFSALALTIYLGLLRTKLV